MHIQLDNFLQSLQGAILYIPVTFRLTLYTFVFSILIGGVIAIIRTYKVPVISSVLNGFVTINMGLPLMVSLIVCNLIFMTYYKDVAAFFHIKKSIDEINPIVVGYFSLILSNCCSYSETIRGGLTTVNSIQYEAGYSIGLNKVQTFFHIIVPQVLPTIIPGLINNLVGTIKGTNLVSAIGIIEIMSGAIAPCARTYSYLEGYLAAALVYWIFSFILETFAKKLEVISSRFRRKII